MKKTKIIVLDALLSAFSCTLICLGSLLGDLDLTFAAAASLPVFWAALELGMVSATSVWAASSIISFVLAPSKFAAVLFAVFVGFYPILKLFFERFRPFISWTFKMISVNVATVILILIAKFIMFPGMRSQLWVYLAVILLANAATVIFDMLLGRLAVIYFAKFRDKLGIFPKDKRKK